MKSIRKGITGAVALGAALAFSPMAFAQSNAKGKFTDTLLDGNSLMYNTLNPAPVKKLLEEHQSRRQDNHKLLFSLVMFEQWLRTVRSNG